jgi:Ca2+-binding EF-hand superfamily protein
MAETASRITSESPVSSITLQITKEDALHFLEASAALMKDVREAPKTTTAKANVLEPVADNHNHNRKVEAQPSLTPPDERKKEASAVFKEEETSHASTSSRDAKPPLYLELYEVARKCQHPGVKSYLERVVSFAVPLLEVQTGVLLFHDMDKASKRKHFLDVFSSSAGIDDTAEETSHSQAAAATSASTNGNGSASNRRVLNRQGALSLFRSVLVAISSCVHTPEQRRCIVEGKPEAWGSAEAAGEPQRKKLKLEEGTQTTSPVSTKGDDQEFRPCQSPSFDSSLATLRDEDDKLGLIKEIEEIAVYAADELIKYSEKKNSGKTDAICLETFEAWYEEAGKSIVPWMELLQVANWETPPKSTAKKPEETASFSESLTPGSLMTEDDASRTLVSFDFSGATSGDETPLCINISEDNLFALKHLEHRTALMHQPATDVCKKLIKMAHRRDEGTDTLFVLHRDDFRHSIDIIIPTEVLRDLTTVEKEAFNASFLDFFGCFEQGKSSLQRGEVDAKELAVGFCFFCAGNKSTKLAAGFELLDDKNVGHLSTEQLTRYLECYLTMLVAVSLLTPMGKHQQLRLLSPKRRAAIRTAVRNGAKWTLGHFLKFLVENEPSVRKDEYTFEVFANWYSVGGYNVSPWLELLDLSKTLSLIVVNDSPIQLPPSSSAFATTERKAPRDRVSTLRRHHSSRRPGPPPEVLFTFPLSNRRSLIVLKEDATYVRAVVEQLGLLSMSPDELWDALTSSVRKQRRGVKIEEGAIYVNMETFVQCMQEVCPRLSKRPAAGSSTSMSSVQELLSNFFHSFDLDQIDSVALDELMGGLCLLCGGKKSTKLAFAFGVFDSRPEVQNKKKKERAVHLLKGEDLFLFLRSILIVTFSCCRQSLDMNDETVGQCITETANMICNDVMNHQFQKRHSDRLNFDDFGEWYNDGGFERAPWLELLDLKKWVLVDDFEVLKTQLPLPPPPPPVASMTPSRPSMTHSMTPGMPVDATCPPPPPEDSLDPGFFDEHGIMPMDSIDEMDMILMQPSTDKDGDEIRSPKLSKSFSFSPQEDELDVPERRGNPLKFQLITNEEHGGYTLSLSQTRIHHFRQILEQSGFHGLDAETACNEILRASTSRKKGETTITRRAFDSAMDRLLPSKNKGSVKEQRDLDTVLKGIFDSFDHEGKGEPSAIQVACGFTVLCKGKKSDKLEFAFEVLDKKKRGQLSEGDMANYLRSFLTVLLSISFSTFLDNDPMEDTLSTMKGHRCERSADAIARAVEKGAEWASSVAFKGFEEAKRVQSSPGSETSMTFDDFADWYTTAGYRTIPWLELLDLRKWVITPETA